MTTLEGPDDAQVVPCADVFTRGTERCWPGVHTKPSFSFENSLHDELRPRKLLFKGIVVRRINGVGRVSARTIGQRFSWYANEEAKHSY